MVRIRNSLAMAMTKFFRFFADTFFAKDMDTEQLF